MSIKIFVYGTLLKGMERASILAESSYLGPAMTQAGLYDLGAYPGIKQGERTTVGELYGITEGTLATLDRIEGYYSLDPSSSLFIRKDTLVRRLADGQKIDARTYFYNYEASEQIMISHGDYRRHLLEEENNDQWILSYGSNISLNRLRKRVGKIDSCKRGFLDGFSLTFNKQASGRQAVYANIAYTGLENQCPAVACKLSRHQIEELDECEGVPNHYLRVSIQFHADSGEVMMAQVYIAHPDKLTCGGFLEPQYLECIRNGYREHGFDESYLDSVVSKE